MQVAADAAPLSNLSSTELRCRLRSPRGLMLRTGPVVFSIRSSLTEVQQGLALHYQRHPVHDEGPQSFCDFHITIRRPLNLRRLFRPQVEFLIDGHSPFQPLAAHQGFAMLEWGMNWSISSQAHQFIVSHAAVLEREGRALVMPAPAGSGKSTLCAALALRGWRLMSDELALLSPRTGLLHALARPVSLKNESIQVIRRFEPSAIIGQEIRETAKGVVAYLKPPNQSVDQNQEPVRPGWLVMPRFVPGAATELIPIDRPQAFMELQRHTFNYDVHGPVAFEGLGNLVAESHCLRLTYSRLEEAIDALGRCALQPEDARATTP